MQCVIALLLSEFCDRRHGSTPQMCQSEGKDPFGCTYGRIRLQLSWFLNHCFVLPFSFSGMDLKLTSMTVAIGDSGFASK